MDTNGNVSLQWYDSHQLLENKLRVTGTLNHQAENEPTSTEVKDKDSNISGKCLQIEGGGVCLRSNRGEKQCSWISTINQDRNSSIRNTINPENTQSLMHWGKKDKTSAEQVHSLENELLYFLCLCPLRSIVQKVKIYCRKAKKNKHRPIILY